MTNGVRVAIALAGAAVTAASPYLYWVSPALLWPAGVMVLAWVVWLVLEYLRWARTLRQR